MADTNTLAGRRQTVNQLTDICNMETSPSLADKIRDVGSSSEHPGLKLIDNITRSDLGGLRPEDFLIYTHNYSNGNEAQFVTNKITIPDLEYLLYEFRFNALCTDLSTKLNLKSLAWMTPESLELGDLSKKSYVLSTDLRRHGTNSPNRSIGIDAIDCDWDELFKEKSAVVKPELNLGYLASKNSIDFDPYHPQDLIHLDHRWPIENLISNSGELALSSYNDLRLGELSHRSSLDLSTDYGYGIGKITGNLDFKHVENYEDKIHELVLKYLPLATKDTVGAVKINGRKYPTSEKPRTYSVKMEEGLSTLYTEVPWVDTNTLSTFTLRTGGTPNTLIFEGYGINKSLIGQSDIRQNTQDTTPIFRQIVTLTPSIPRNVLLSENVDTTQPNKQCLARFSSSRNHLEIEDGPEFERGKTDEYLTRDGTWRTLPIASATQSGFMPKESMKFVNDMKAQTEALGGNLYVLPVATKTDLGGIKTGYSTDASHGLYAVQLNRDNQAFVNVPNPITEYKGDVGKIADNSIGEMLKKLYPVGAIYITVSTTCPLTELIPGSTWAQVSKGQCLWGYNGSTRLGQSIDAGLPALPAHSHTVSFGFSSSSGSGGLPYHGGSNQCAHSSNSFTTSSANYSSNIYGKSTTVQPPAFVVNIFKRTA